MANVLTALAPTDEADRILEIANRVAAADAATIHTLNVVEPAVTIYADLNFTPLVECAADWQRELINANRDFLEAKDGVHNLEIVEGNPAREISRAADRLDAALIVMGVHNRRGVRRLLGSTTHAVLNTSERDVLAVHPDGESQAYKSILIAVDTADLLTTVLKKAAPFAKQAESVAVISVMLPLASVFAGPVPSRELSWSFEGLAADIEAETTKKISKAMRANNIDAPLSIRVGDPRDEIVDVAEAQGADLMVIGSNQKGALSRLLLGSTARAVLNNTPCDVLVCRHETTS